MNQILVGKGERPVHLLARYGNRHGLVAGATGTGKTVSLSLRKGGGGVEGDRSGYPLYGLYLPRSSSLRARRRTQAAAAKNVVAVIAEIQKSTAQ